MLLICPVRPGVINEELRFSLRSWETNLILEGGLELWTIGYQPRWLNPDRHIPGNRFKSLPLAVFDNIREASRIAAEYTSSALYMNDDFFCLDPVGSILPVRRNCTIAEQVAKFPLDTTLWWPRSLRLTGSWLAEQGFPNPDSYEVHRPLIADPRVMTQLLDKWDIASDSTVPQWRTVYGVMSKLDAYPVRDMKLGVKAPGVGTPWISTSDETWRRYARSIEKRFQKPSRWEVS